MAVSFVILKRCGSKGEKGRKEYTTILKKKYGPNFFSLIIAAVGPSKQTKKLDEHTHLLKSLV